MSAFAGYLLDHPWAFMLVLGGTVTSIVGVILLGAWLLVPPAPRLDPKAEALRSLREMHPGPRSIP